MLRQAGYEPKKSNLRILTKLRTSLKRQAPMLNEWPQKKPGMLRRLIPARLCWEAIRSWWWGGRLFKKRMMKRNRKRLCVCCLENQPGFERRLSGRQGWKGNSTAFDHAAVSKKLSETEIREYIAGRDWVGCSGFKIEGMMEAFIRKIIGSYSGVVGLPLYETKCLLNGVGIR